MKKTTSLLFLSLFIFIISCNNTQKDTKNKGASEKPNILFIMADDLKPEIQAYGIKRAHTPSLDKLASQGMMFTNTYAQQAICAASRASLFSGMRPDAIGVDYPYSEYYVNEVVPKHPTLFKFFYQHGYQMATMGKLHHDPYIDDIPVEHNFYRTEEYFDSANQYIYNSTPGRRNNKVKKLPPFELAYLPDSVYDDCQMANGAIQFLKNYSDSEQNKPFFLAIGFWKPHAPYVAPGKYADLYNLEDIELAENPENTSGLTFSIPGLATLDRYKRENDTIKGHVTTKQRAREVIRAYLACVSFIDNLIGNIISALEETGLSKNTIIVFTSDHGYHLGNHGTWGKTTNYECATRAPFIVVAPGAKGKGIETNAFTELVDIYPTLVEYAGFEVPEFLEGTSFKKVLENPECEWKNAAFSQYPRTQEIEGYSIRTRDYRYVQWHKKQGTEKLEIIGQELYDEKNDPLEMNNLALNDNYKEVLDDMKTKLNNGWKSALPQGIVNNSNNPLAPFPVRWQNPDLLIDKSDQYVK